VLTQVRSGKYLPLRMQAPDIPPALEHIILKAMNYRAGRRYSDAAEMALDLERYLEVETASRVRQGPAPRWGKRRTRLAGALVLLVMAAFVAAFVASPPNSGKKSERPHETVPLGGEGNRVAGGLSRTPAESSAEGFAGPDDR